VILKFASADLGTLEIGENADGLTPSRATLRTMRISSDFCAWLPCEKLRRQRPGPHDEFTGRSVRCYMRAQSCDDLGADRTCSVPVKSAVRGQWGSLHFGLRLKGSHGVCSSSFQSEGKPLGLTSGFLCRDLFIRRQRHAGIIRIWL